jgi:hypothetical protein
LEEKWGFAPEELKCFWKSKQQNPEPGVCAGNSLSK